MNLETHEKWMGLALRLASRGKYSVSPNPMVGACIVKGDRLISSGYHRKFGGPHAERIALERAGRRARGATLYVTLEPCSSWQKTPPCASLILERGIKEVVIGSLDPNPLNHRKGIAYLKKNQIRVVWGILESKVREQNQGFFTLIAQGRPFVTLKMAVTLDGKIATREGKSRWISSALSRNFVHQLRTQQDAVLVGKNTFYLDDPRITVPARARCLKNGRPWKIVLVSDEKIPHKPRIFQDSRMVFFACPRSKMKSILKKMETVPGAFNLLPVEDKNGELDIRDLLGKLGGLGIARLLVEGGGELAWSLIKSGCVDHAVWILAPKIFGGRDAKTSVEGRGVASPDQAYGFIVEKTSKSGQDFIFQGKIEKKDKKE